MKNQHHKIVQLPVQFPVQGFLKDMDERTNLYNTLAGTFNEICSDLGGEENLSRIQIILIERVAFLMLTLRRLERRIRNKKKKKGRAAAFRRWTTAVNSLLGLSRTLGIKKSKKKTANIKMYAASQGKKKA